MDPKPTSKPSYVHEGQQSHYRQHLKHHYEPGEVFCTATPYAHIVKSYFKGRYCDNCISPASEHRTLTKCTGCEYDCYCGPECLRAAWAFHRFECSLLSQWRAKGKAWAELLDKTRLLFRVLSRRQTECAGRDGAAVESTSVDAADEFGFPAVKGPGWFRTFDDLLSHSQDLEGRSDIYGPVLENFAEFCGDAGQLAFRLPSTHEEMVTVFGRIRSNWFDLCDGLLNRMGEAIYFSPSAINHGCLANCTPITYGLRQDYRTLRKVDTSREEMLYNYVLWERLPATADRQEYFKYEYFFECKCPLCDGSPAAKKRDARLTSARCVYGDDCRLKPDCDYCLSDGSRNPTELEAAYKQVKNVLAALESAEEARDSRSVIALATAYLDEKQTLGVCNALVVEVREKLVRACYEADDRWETGVEEGRILLDVYQLVYPNWPTLPVGKLRFILGAMSLRGGSPKAAVEHLQEARNIMTVILGSEHEYVIEIERQLTMALSQSRASSA